MWPERPPCDPEKPPCEPPRCAHTGKANKAIETTTAARRFIAQFYACFWNLNLNFGERQGEPPRTGRSRSNSRY